MHLAHSLAHNKYSVFTTHQPSLLFCMERLLVYKEMDKQTNSGWLDQCSRGSKCWMQWEHWRKGP